MLAFKCMANNILCRGAQGHLLKFRMAMSRNPFSHPTKIFQAHINLQTNYLYIINQRRNGHTLIPLQKRQQLHSYHAPLRSERSRSCSLIQTEDSHFTHQLNLLPTDSSREGVSVSPVVIIHLQVIHSSRHLDPPPTAPLDKAT